MKSKTSSRGSLLRRSIKCDLCHTQIKRVSDSWVLESDDDASFLHLGCCHPKETDNPVSLTEYLLSIFPSIQSAQSYVRIVAA